MLLFLVLDGKVDFVRRVFDYLEVSESLVNSEES